MKNLWQMRIILILLVIISENNAMEFFKNQRCEITDGPFRGLKVTILEHVSTGPEELASNAALYNIILARVARLSRIEKGQLTENLKNGRLSPRTIHKTLPKTITDPYVYKVLTKRNQELFIDSLHLMAINQEDMHA